MCGFFINFKDCMHKRGFPKFGGFIRLRAHINSVPRARNAFIIIPMRNRNVPFAHAASLYEIDIAFFKKLGIKYILTDLDNTLDPNFIKEPEPHAFELKKKLDEAGIQLIIVSNNSGERVHRYARLLGVTAECFMNKPFSGRLKKMMAAHGIAKEEAIMVGDQIQTDVIAANGAGVRAILTEPLSKKEPPWTLFNRLFDRPKRKSMAKKGLLKDWREFL